MSFFICKDNLGTDIAFFKWLLFFYYCTTCCADANLLLLFPSTDYLLWVAFALAWAFFLPSYWSALWLNLALCWRFVALPGSPWPMFQFTSLFAACKGIILLSSFARGGAAAKLLIYWLWSSDSAVALLVGTLEQIWWWNVPYLLLSSLLWMY